MQPRICRVLKPSGYLMLWEDAFNFCQGKHLAVADVLPCVDAIAWDKGYYGQGARARRQGSYLAILQKPPIKARATWKDHKIPDRWTERIIRPKSQHPHLKPIGLIARLIGAVTVPGDLVVDPAAGSFVVMRVANEMGAASWAATSPAIPRSQPRCGAACRFADR